MKKEISTFLKCVETEAKVFGEIILARLILEVRNTENIALANVYIKMLQTSEQQLCVLIDRWMEEQIDKLKSEEEAWSQVLQNTGVIHQKEIPFVDRKIECSGHQ